MACCIAFLAIGFPLVTHADEAQELYRDGLVHMEQQEYRKSVKALEAAIQVFPKFAEAHHLLGVVYFNGLYQPAKAIEHLNKAVSLHPNFARAFLDLGLIYQHETKLPEAEASLVKAVDIYPNFVEAHLALAHLFTELFPHHRLERIELHPASIPNKGPRLTLLFDRWNRVFTRQLPRRSRPVEIIPSHTPDHDLLTRRKTGRLR